MSHPDPAWIEKAFAAARPKAMAALLRYFSDLDRAEEAFQDACLRALANWPKNGPPRDPTAWLVFVGRNAGIDAVRRKRNETALPDEASLSDRDDQEMRLAERLDEKDYRDDILRLLFVCCHPDLAPTQQVALALRIVSGLSVSRIARAFLVSDAAMEQRITRAKAKIASAGLPFEAPDPQARAERLTSVAAMLYLVFNEGYSARASQPPGPAPAPQNHDPAMLLADEAIRLARLLIRLFPDDPEIMGLLALFLLQHARASARFDAEGDVVLLEDQDRGLWNRAMIEEGLVMVDKALRHRSPGPYQIQAAIAAVHARAHHAQDTDWRQIEALYQALEHIAPSPVITLNRAVALSKTEGPQAALDLTEPLADRLQAYFYFHGLRGHLFKTLGNAQAAHAAFNRAIALATTPAEAAHIRRELDGL